MHFLWSCNIALDLFLIEMKFSPPAAAQTCGTPPSEWVMQGRSDQADAAVDLYTVLLRRTCLVIMCCVHWLYHMSLSVKSSLGGFLKVVTSAVLCWELREQVISPHSKLPRACCTWLSQRHIPGWKDRQARTQRADSDTLVQQPQV